MQLWPKRKEGDRQLYSLEQKFSKVEVLNTLTECTYLRPPVPEQDLSSQEAAVLQRQSDISPTWLMRLSPFLGVTESS